MANIVDSRTTALCRVFGWSVSSGEMAVQYMIHNVKLRNGLDLLDEVLGIGPSLPFDDHIPGEIVSLAMAFFDGMLHGSLALLVINHPRVPPRCARYYPVNVAFALSLPAFMELMKAQTSPIKSILKGLKFYNPPLQKWTEEGADDAFEELMGLFSQHYGKVCIPKSEFIRLFGDTRQGPKLFSMLLRHTRRGWVRQSIMRAFKHCNQTIFTPSRLKKCVATLERTIEDNRKRMVCLLDNVGIVLGPAGIIDDYVQ